MVNTHPGRRVPIWESAKKEKRKGRLLRIAFLVVLLVIMANFLIRGPAFLRGLNRPLSAFPNDNVRIVSLDFSFRTNLLLVSYKKSGELNDIAVASYEPGDQRLTVLTFNLPENKTLQSATQAIFTEKGVGGVQNFVSNSLGIPIDRYFAVSGDDFNFDSTGFFQVKNSLQSPFIFFKAFSLKQKLSKVLETNASGSDLLKIVLKVRAAKFEEKDVALLKNSGEENFPNEKISSLVSNLFTDRRILAEGAALTIRNGSGKGGLGSTLERYLTNLGATVVAVESSEALEGQSYVVVKSKKSEIEKRLLAIISFKDKKIKNENFSGDILVVLGADAAGELTLP